MTSAISRRSALKTLAAALPAAWISPRSFAQTKVPMVVYKDPSCGCCHKWVEHMTANGFTAAVTDTSDMAKIRALYKVPEKLQGCHTANVGGYVVEGHVPAADVKALLAKKPKGIVGLTIPGMPASAPGMDVKPFVPYTVLSFDEKGVTTVFAQHDKA
jgi:hypothetical protein